MMADLFDEAGDEAAAWPQTPEDEKMWREYFWDLAKCLEDNETIYQRLEMGAAMILPVVGHTEVTDKLDCIEFNKAGI